MSPLLLTCCVLFLAAFCVLAYVIENWRILRRAFESPDGPRRWGWIQSWSPEDELLNKELKKAEEVTRKKLEEWKKFDAHITAEIKAHKDKQALQLYKDGWRCGRFTETGNQTLFRGESEAYVSFDVWTEVERLTKVGNKNTNWAIGVDPNRENILFKDGTLHVPEGSRNLDWSKIPPASSTHVDWKQFGIRYGDQGNGDVIMPGAFGDSIKNWNEKNPRTQVTEVNEVPDGIYKYITGLKWSKVRTKGSRFLPSVNPLGDTAAFTRTIFYDPMDPPEWVKMGKGKVQVSFRHKKGGSRG